MKSFLQKQLIRILALSILFLLYFSAKLPRIDDSYKEKMAESFKFEVIKIDIGEASLKKNRRVHPSYEHISSWISSVGAAATFTDISGKGIFNDLILTEPRTDKVYLIPESKSPQFIFEVTQLPYSNETMAPMGTLSADFDENGEMDVLIYYWGRTPVIFYQNSGSFEEKELTNTNEKWYTNAATLADVNGDGSVDIILGNYFPDSAEVLNVKNTEFQFMQHSMSRADNGSRNRLFLSNYKSKTGFLEDEDWLEGLGTPLDWTLALAAADINNDLLPEIYIANDFGPDKLLLNRSTTEDVKFELLKGTRSLTTMASSVLGKDSFKGMGADFADINGDGLLDIYVSNIAAEYALEESHFLFLNTGNFKDMTNGLAPFENESESLGLSRSSWGWDCKLADFNNDGTKEAIQATGFIKGEVNRWPELHEVAMGNDELLSNASLWHKFKLGDDLCGNAHNPFFVKDQNGYFFDIASQLGIDQEQVTRGLAISDIDHDGDLDFVVANQWEDSRLYINNNDLNNQTGAFIGLSIYQSINNQKTTVNTFTSRYPAIGCQVRILKIDGVKLADNKQLIGYVNGGNGHSGVDSCEVHFGLGNIDSESSIALEFKWIDRNGKRQKEILTLSPGWHEINLKQDLKK
ncbi:CRTAC1 family protein [Changchengzhania lutea]|uniref:CRTAC1 family protein n=1 Tax=Changchengzhania lutea TaxID=2049305 RepID=UPI00115D4DAE|nr:CRTAC1 family protein [Changchengzhania lutea]